MRGERHSAQVRNMTVRARRNFEARRRRRLRQQGDGAAQCYPLRFCLAHQLHEDFALTSALATKTAQDFVQGVLERLGWVLQPGHSDNAGRDELEDFFCAL
jgi:hypothetical protein